MLIIPDKSLRTYAENKYFRWNELHEVFWLIVPIIVFIICIIINYRRTKAKREKPANS